MADEHAIEEWLIKDFNALYRITKQTLLAIRAFDSGVPPSKLRGAVEGLVAQLERLKPAFDVTESVRATMRSGDTSKNEADDPIVKAFEEYLRERKTDESR